MLVYSTVDSGLTLTYTLILCMCTMFHKKGDTHAVTEIRSGHPASMMGKLYTSILHQIKKNCHNSGMQTAGGGYFSNPG